MLFMKVVSRKPDPDCVRNKFCYDLIPKTIRAIFIGDKKVEKSNEPLFISALKRHSKDFSGHIRFQNLAPEQRDSFQLSVRPAFPRGACFHFIHSSDSTAEVERERERESTEDRGGGGR